MCFGVLQQRVCVLQLLRFFGLLQLLRCVLGCCVFLGCYNCYVLCFGVLQLCCVLGSATVTLCWGATTLRAVFWGATTVTCCVLGCTTVACCVLGCYNCYVLYFGVLQLLRAVFWGATTVVCCVLGCYNCCVLCFGVLQLLCAVFLGATTVACCVLGSTTVVWFQGVTVKAVTRRVSGRNNRY